MSRYIRMKTEYDVKLKSYKEKWKRIIYKGEKTDYKISNHGRIYNMKLGRISECTIKDTNAMRYVNCELTFGDKRINIGVHRLVAMYFCKIPKRHEKKGLGFTDLIPNHKDGIKYHNAAFNLEWVTPKENTKHAFREGLCDNIRGENSHLATMKDKDCIQICELIMQKKTNKEIVEFMTKKGIEVTAKMVQHIRAKECWKHITKNYDFPKLSDTIPYKISEETIHEICKLIASGEYTDSQIAEKFSTDRKYVNDIRNKKRRKSISDLYFQGKAQRLSKAYHKRKTYGKKQVEYTTSVVEVRGMDILGNRVYP